MRTRKSYKKLNITKSAPPKAESIEKQKNIKGDFVKLDSLKDIAKEKGVSANDIPEEFTASVVSTDTDTDDFNRKCLIAILNIDGVGEAKVKYTPLHVEELVKALQRINIDEFAGKFKFKKIMIGTMGFARPYPIEKIV